MLNILRFFFSSSKCRLFHNATVFGSCIIHVLNTGVLEFERKFRRLKVKFILILSSHRRIDLPPQVSLPEPCACLMGGDMLEIAGKGERKYWNRNYYDF